MNRIELLKFDDAESLARAAASQWIGSIIPGIRHAVAFSGGRISRTFFRAIADLNSARAALERTEFFWADERCVAPDDPESNFRLANEALLQPVGIPATRIHRIRGESPPVTAAQDAGTELCQVVTGRHRGLPVLDLVFLGMGEDGHVASLFPGDACDPAADLAIYRPVTGPKLPAQRITLGYGPIVNSREVWVLVSGSGKEAALQESLASQSTTPLGRVLQLRARSRIFTDLPVSR